MKNNILILMLLALLALGRGIASAEEPVAAPVSGEDEVLLADEDELAEDDEVALGIVEDEGAGEDTGDLTADEIVADPAEPEIIDAINTATENVSSEK